MMDYLIQIVTAFTGSLGFAIVFNIKKDKILLAAVGGALAWGAYILAGTAVASDAIRYYIASIVLTFYAEIMARVKKTPVTIFLVPATIPLIPGGSLYQTMRYAVALDQDRFASQGLYTLLLAGAIAAGILSTMTIWKIIARATQAEIMKKH